jgi:hypothetical protein
MCKQLSSTFPSVSAVRRIKNPERRILPLYLVNSACFLAFPTPSRAPASGGLFLAGGGSEATKTVLPGPRNHQRVGRLRASISAPFAQQPGTPQPPGTPPQPPPDPTAPPPYEDPPRPIPIPSARSAGRCDRRPPAAPQRLGIYKLRSVPLTRPADQPSGTDQPLAPIGISVAAGEKARLSPGV